MCFYGVLISVQIKVSCKAIKEAENNEKQI
jgi:hypothetical protein